MPRRPDCLRAVYGESEALRAIRGEGIARRAAVSPPGRSAREGTEYHSSFGVYRIRQQATDFVLLPTPCSFLYGQYGSDAELHSTSSPRYVPPWAEHAVRDMPFGK